MQFKPVPPAPADRAAVRAAARAVPLVPDPAADCCARLQARADEAGVEASDRDAAQTWLTFLRALGLVAETDRGYTQVQKSPDDAGLAKNFRERVYGAETALAALDDGPADLDGVFAACREDVPRWERARDPAWETTWRDRTRRLMDWAVLLGLAVRVADDPPRWRRD